MKLAILPGHWANYRQRFAHEIAERDAANRPSYLVDEAIAALHKGIGFAPSAEDHQYRSVNISSQRLPTT